MARSKDVNKEHIEKDEKTGAIKGTYRIDVEKAWEPNAAEPLWNAIDNIIREWVKLNPNTARMHMMEVKQISANRMNDHASTKDKSMRWGASIPPGLYFTLMRLEPRLFDDKKLFNRFLKRYKGFRICKTV